MPRKLLAGYFLVNIASFINFNFFSMFNIYPTLEKYPNSDFFCLKKTRRALLQMIKKNVSFQDTFEGTIWIFVFFIFVRLAVNVHGLNEFEITYSYQNS